MTPGRAARCAGVLLAAGRSRRMGRTKQLLEFRGETLLRRAARALLESRADPILIVVPPGDAFTNALAGLSIAAIANDDAGADRAASLRLALRALAESGSCAALVHLGDMPLVTPRMLRLLLRRYHRADADAVVTSRDGIDRPPLVLGPRAVDTIHESAQPPRHLLRHACLSVRRLRLPPDALLDIDTPADYARIAAV